MFIAVFCSEIRAESLNVFDADKSIHHIPIIQKKRQGRIY